MSWSKFVNGVKRMFKKKDTVDKLRGASTIGSIVATIFHIL